VALHFSERERARYSRDNVYGRDPAYSGRDQEYSERDQDYGHRERGRDDRDFFDRASDEVRSWFGSDAAEYRRERDGRERDRRREREQTFERMDENLDHVPARQLMTREVATVHSEDRVERAALLMRECDCGALPVVNDTGRLIGMITDRDIVMRLVARGRDTRSARVEDAMTDDAYSCHASDEVEDCIQSMARHKVRRMPIVDDRNRVIGILSQGDLAQFAGRRHGGEAGRKVVDVLSEISEPSSRSHR
jgi:CBS domain-containing protein